MSIAHLIETKVAGLEPCNLVIRLHPSAVRVPVEALGFKPSEILPNCNGFNRGQG